MLFSYNLCVIHAIEWLNKSTYEAEGKRMKGPKQVGKLASVNVFWE